jgi:hypothetical protein
MSRDLWVTRHLTALYSVRSDFNWATEGGGTSFATITTVGGSELAGRTMPGDNVSADARAGVLPGTGSPRGSKHSIAHAPTPMTAKPSAGPIGNASRLRRCVAEPK